MRIAKVTELRVTCPYCEIGHAVVFVEHKNGADQLHGVKDPRQCSACGRYFALAIGFHVTGKRLPEAGPSRSQGDALRTLISNSS